MAVLKKAAGAQSQGTEGCSTMWYIESSREPWYGGKGASGPGGASRAVSDRGTGGGASTHDEQLVRSAIPTTYRPWSSATPHDSGTPQLRVRQTVGRCLKLYARRRGSLAITAGCWVCSEGCSEPLVGPLQAFQHDRRGKRLIQLHDLLIKFM